MSIELGSKVKDKLTGFVGTAVARAEYLYGCAWLCVVPKELHDGKPIEDAWFDEQRLEPLPIRKSMRPKKRPFERESTLNWRGGPVPKIPKRSKPSPHL